MRARVPFAPPFVAEFPPGKEGDLVYYAVDRQMHFFDGTAWIPVGNLELADGSVTTPKLANSAVTNIKLADGSVTALKIVDGSVTTAKLADNSITNTKIPLNTIGIDKLQQISAFNLIGNSTGVTGIPHQIAIGAGLSFSMGVLIATGGGGGIPEAPTDSQDYARNNAGWVVLNWGSLDGKPSTLAGYGISDAAPLSHVGTGAGAHANATTSVAGFMSGGDKTKLDGIATGANTRGINTALRSEGSATLVVGTSATIIIPYNMTISVAASWVIASDTTASVVVGVLRATVAAPNTFVSIAASAKPALTAAVRATGAMTGWATSLLAGERVRLSVESASGTTAVQVLIPAEAT